jgi:DNA polymerase II small subunit
VVGTAETQKEIDPELRQLVGSLLEKGVLVSPDLFDVLAASRDTEAIKEVLRNNTTLLVLNKDILNTLLASKKQDVNWAELDKSRVLYEKKKQESPYLSFVDYLNKVKGAGEAAAPLRNAAPEMELDDVKPINLYRETLVKLEVQNFISYLNSRYKSIESLLINRRELQNVTSISRILSKKDREEVALIGMVRDKEITTKNKHIKLALEDPSGVINVLVNKNNQELYSIAKDSMLDEVMGVRGTTGDKIVFANSLLHPDIPLYKEMKKCKKDVCAVVLSDLHVGSTNFLDKDLEKGISWLKGEIGNENQREMASKVKYVFLLGDLVEGVGVYPDQNKELIIKDIYDQYEACAGFLKEIPKSMRLIIIPGNHDAVRLEEPQPPLYDDMAAPILKIPNVMMLSNPSTVNIMQTKDFPGFDFLLYHGYSFPFYADNVESIRLKGGIDRADLIMQFLLQRRHLSPSHSSTLYNPDPHSDPLVIDKVPDFFMTGHLHKTNIANYKNVTMISGSCWQTKTTFMEKIGIHPEPSRVPVINLSTREVKIMRFGK